MNFGGVWEEVVTREVTPYLDLRQAGQVPQVS